MVRNGFLPCAIHVDHHQCKLMWFVDHFILNFVKLSYLVCLIKFALLQITEFVSQISLLVILVVSATIVLRAIMYSIVNNAYVFDCHG